MSRRSGSGAPRRDVSREWVLRSLVGIAGVLATVLAWQVWQHRDLLPRMPEEGFAPVQRVLVEGPFENVSPFEVEEAVLPHLTGGFFTVDLDAIRRAAEDLPWVGSAQVVRDWPDRVRIVVTEQRAAWRWGEDGLLNERGELFVTGVAVRPQTLPRLDGPRGYEAQLVRQYLDLDATLGACAMRVRALELDARRSLRLALDGGIDLRLGREAVERRVERFCDVVVEALAPRLAQVAYVDMRYTNGFAVGWRTEEGAS